jgi:hypothetical protein
MSFDRAIHPGSDNWGDFGWPWQLWCDCGACPLVLPLSLCMVRSAARSEPLGRSLRVKRDACGAASAAARPWASGPDGRGDIKWQWELWSDYGVCCLLCCCVFVWYAPQHTESRWKGHCVYTGRSWRCKRSCRTLGQTEGATLNGSRSCGLTVACAACFAAVSLYGTFCNTQRAAGKFTSCKRDARGAASTAAGPWSTTCSNLVAKARSANVLTETRSANVLTVPLACLLVCRC